MFKISVYGKGGIGKSTLSSNISYGLSKHGLKVLHVGCDPKHDSTRLLTNGVLQKTFLDYLNDHDPEGVMENGSGDITCVECGGATPGIGCAGKGMMRLFDYLDGHLPEEVDARVNDVLGDVVCGGFSVPMRKENCDALIIVTSEEFMALYAANCILRGMLNINGEKRLLGMIVNSREPTMSESVRIFSEATGTRILGRVSRSSVFAEAEASGKTVLEQFPDSEAAKQIEAILEQVMRAYNGEDVCTMPHPLTDAEMYDIAAGRPVGSLKTEAKEEEKEVKEFEEVDRERGVRYLRAFAVPSCTSHGAGEFLLTISDAAVVYNGPDNCAFLTEYAHRRRYLKVAGRVGPFANCNLYSAGMDDDAAFSGSMDKLEAAVDRAKADGFRTIFLVSTCSSSIIGADLKKEAEKLTGDGVRVIAVPEDKTFLGGKFGNFAGAVSALSDLMDWSQPQIPDTVNILGFGTSATERDLNREYLEKLLALMGLRINMFFLGVTDVESIKNVPRAQYNLIFGDEGLGGVLVRNLFKDGRGYISAKDGTTGRLCAHRFIDILAEATGRKGQAEDAKREIDRMYSEAVASVRRETEGKTALIFSRSLYGMDTYIDMLDTIGMTVPCIAVRKRDMIIDREEPVITGSDIIEDIGFCDLKGIIEKYRPDIVLSADSRVGTLGCKWSNMGMPSSGVRGLAMWADKIRNCMKLPDTEEWRCEI